MSQYSVNNRIKELFTQLLQQPAVQQGLAFIEADQPRSIEEQKIMVAIEAPTFTEKERAAYYADCFQRLGLVDVHIDSHGNVLGRRPGKGKGPKILLEGHLDTVFPAGTNTQPVEKEGKIYAPGICDDTRALAANLSVIRA